jgi:hypothetical protein
MHITGVTVAQPSFQKNTFVISLVSIWKPLQDIFQKMSRVYLIFLVALLSSCEGFVVTGSIKAANDSMHLRFDKIE